MTAHESEHPSFKMPEVHFSKFLGFNTESPQPGRSEVAMELQPQHLNIVGVAHGGFLTTLMDNLMAHAIFTGLADPLARFATSHMTTHFLRAVRGGRVTGRGHMVSANEEYLSAEAELRDEADRLVATAEALFTRL